MTAARRPLIVVAEDDPLLRLDARLSLEEEGFAVIETGDGWSALDAIATHDDVEGLFTDVQMPGSLGGVDLAWRAHDLRPKLRLIVTSGSERLTGADLPTATRFFPKPYALSAVAAALRSGEAG